MNNIQKDTDCQLVSIEEAHLEQVTGGEIRQVADALRQPNITVDTMAEAIATNKFALDRY